MTKHTEGPGPATAPELNTAQTQVIIPLKIASIEEQVAVKAKVLSAEDSKKKYTLSASDSALVKQKQRLLFTKSQETADFKNLIAIESLAEEFTQEALTELGVYLPVETTTIENVKAILEKREVVAATKIVDFDLDYKIEVIPRPDANKIYSLTTKEKNVFDVPVYGPNIDTNDLEEKHVLKNFVLGSGGTYSLSINGVKGTSFEVAVYNETDNTYYNWNTISVAVVSTNPSETYINTVAGSFQLGVNYYQGVIPSSGKEIVDIHIPFVSVETVYKFGFVNPKERGLTIDYGNLPMFGEKTRPLYKITQLPGSSTTVKLQDSQELGNSNGDGDLVISHTPGSKLNSSNATKGKHSIELTISPRKEIALAEDILNGVVSMRHFEISEGGTEILNTDLAASVTNNIGTIKGTITFGKASLRPSIINIRASDIFSINQSKT